MMKLVTILLLLFTTGDLTDIAKINKLKKNAEVAYKSGQYDIAITNYVQLVDSMGIEEDEILLNLGHAYYQSGDPANAESQYKLLTTSTNTQIKSIAYQQLGFLSNDPKTLENALSYFKAALKADPTNEDARYNYELIKKKLRNQNENLDQEDQQNQDQNDEDKKDQEQQENEEKQDGENQDQEQEKQDQEGGDENQEQQDQEGQEDSQEQEKQDGENQEDGEQSEEQQGEEGKEGEEGEQQQGEQSEDGEEGEEGEQQQQGEEQEEGDENQEMTQQQQTAQKLEEMNISEEKAKMILEALKNSEVQYIQQNRRRPSQNRDSDKPDW